MERGRSGFLDALRGVAILGILPVNVAYFAFPATLADEPAWPAGGAAAVHGVRFLFEGKFLTIFALLFGAGMVILRDRTVASGGRWGPLVARRLLVLWGLGCAHALLVWYGDIAAYYGLLGLTVCWTPGRSPATLRRWGTALLALPLIPILLTAAGALAGVGWVEEIVRGVAAPEPPDGRIPGGVLSFDPDAEIAIYGAGSFASGVLLRFVTWAFAVAVALPLWGPLLLGLFLLGMAFAREGWFLEPGSEEGRRRFTGMLRWGLAVGLPLTAVDLLVQVLAPRSVAAIPAAFASHCVGSLGLAAAIVALVARATVRWPEAGAIRALSAVGRTAFSNYLLQSAVLALVFQGSTVFLGAGLGLFATLGRWEVLGIAAALGAAQVGASVLWLRAFRMGPVEWGWRAATHLRWPEMGRGGR